MNKYLRRFLAVVICLSLLCVCVYADQSTETADTSVDISGEQARSFVDNAVHIIMSKYKFDITREEIYKSTLEKLIEENPELYEDVMKAMFDSLDKHSTYYTQEELETFLDGMSGEFCGIGVLITTVDEGLLITNVYDNSPAKDVGLLAGDVITKVYDTSLAGIDVSVAQSMILGQENTPVTLTISRNGSTFEINPVRRKIIIDSGFYETIEDDSIGYIQLSEFNDPAVSFVKRALEDFDTKNIKDIIIDLRNNPGGSVDVMVDLCSLFIPTGPAIHFEFKNPFNNTTLYAQNENVKYNLVILVNQNSASASEAFAAAVQDTGVGIVVGTKTYGKGTMQNLDKFIVGGGIKLTVAEYLSRNKRKINNIGVTPDVYVEDKVVPYTDSNYQKINYDRVLKIGDVGNDVYAIEQRLYFLGYTIGLPDDIYDSKTHDAILYFQKNTGLYPYGVADITTQLKLESVLNGYDVIQNDSFDKAVEIVKNGEINSFKGDWSNTPKETTP